MTILNISGNTLPSVAYYSVVLHRGVMEPFELGTIPSLDDLSQWLSSAVKVIPYLIRPQWTDEIRVTSSEGDRVRTFRLGLVEVQPMQPEEPKQLMMVVQ